MKHLFLLVSPETTVEAGLILALFSKVKVTKGQIKVTEGQIKVKYFLENNHHAMAYTGVTFHNPTSII